MNKKQPFKKCCKPIYAKLKYKYTTIYTAPLNTFDQLMLHCLKYNWSTVIVSLL